MRLDQWLIEQEFFESREKARQEILMGHVRRARSGELLDKPGWRVPKDLEVEIIGRARFVSRAGDKLEGFLEHIDSCASYTTDHVCLDVGSSTGGFSDCLLQRGARQVFAVDVGTHQLHERLRADSRLQLFEQTDIRDFDPAQVDCEPRLVTIDVSFISLKKVLPSLVQNCPKARFVMLFKPQFELGRFVKRKKGGVVYEEDAEKCLQEFLQFLPQLGLNSKTWMKSALKGSRGNQEYLILAEPAHQIMEASSLKVFRTYDIRGHAQNDLSDELFVRIGAALAQKVASKAEPTQTCFRIGVGCDERESSPRLVAALKRGLRSHPRVQIVSLGALTTPMVYFASHQYELDAALQVTASHNPAPDNGIKMMIGRSTLFGDEIQELGKAALELDLESLTESSTFEEEDFFEKNRKDYLNFLHGQFQFKKTYRVAVDCANGMAGMIVRSALEPYCSHMEILHEKVDCSFPNHPADPTVPENMEALQEMMRSGDYELGFAYDGDGDRVGLVSAKGRIIWGDEILMLLSEKVLKERPGSSIIGEVKCSQKLFKRIKDLGGDPVMYRTGHSLIKKQMKELKAPIAGEMSGHMFFADRFFGFDDSIYASLRIIESLEELGCSLDDWIEQFPPSYTTPEIRVEIEDHEREGLIEKIKSHYSNRGELNLIDGVRASFEDGSWVLVRASNTQPVLVVRIEGSSEDRLKALREELSGVMKREL